MRRYANAWGRIKRMVNKRASTVWLTQGNQEIRMHVDKKNYPSWLSGAEVERLVKDVDGGATVDSVLQVYAANSFLKHIVENKLVLHEWDWNGVPTVPLAEVQAFIDTLGLFPLHRDITGKGDATWFYAGDKMTMRIGPTSDNRGNDDSEGSRWLEIMSCDHELIESLIASFKKFFIKKVTKGSVYALVARPGGLEFASMGVAGSSLIRDNYSADVLKGFDHIIKDLRSPVPSGRLSIIDGPAGTGKTHLIKGLLTEARAMFVMIAPEAITQLSSPSIIPLLVDAREEYHQHGGQPIVFILEDADDALVPRDISNMSIISSLLNYTDGIFGTLFDLRILATTNAKKVDIESALLRSGRLSCQMTVGPLAPDEATRVYQRLAKDTDANPNFVIKEEMTLADIYAMARGYEKTEAREPLRLGFK